MGMFYSTEARSECYVDDPLFAFRGSFDHRSRLIALIICVWRSLGCRLAFSKAKRSSLCGKAGIDWISASHRIFKFGVIVTVKQSLIADVYSMALDFSKRNVVAIRDLRSFAGKVNNLCSVVYTLTPFLRQIWGCLSAEALPVKGAPPNTI